MLVLSVSRAFVYPDFLEDALAAQPVCDGLHHCRLVPVEIEPILALLLLPKRLASTLQPLAEGNDLFLPLPLQAGIDDPPLEKPEGVDKIGEYQHLDIVILRWLELLQRHGSPLSYPVYDLRSTHLFILL